MASKILQTVAADVDDFDVGLTLQILFTLSEEDWNQTASEHLSKLPSFLYSLKPAEQPLDLAGALLCWPHDSTLPSLQPTAVDAREVLSILVTLSSTIGLYAVRDYVTLISNAYKYVVLGNMRRRLNNMKGSSLPSSPEETLRVRNSLLDSMKPWSRDILELLEKHILPILVLRDACPKTVERSVDSNNVAGGVPPALVPVKAHPQDGDSRKTPWTSEHAQLTGGCPVRRPGSAVFTVIANLLDDMAQSSTLYFRCARCAVALYGTMWSSIPLCHTLSIGGIPVLERIRFEYAQINQTSVTADFAAAKEAIPESDAHVFPSAERAALREAIFKLLCRALDLDTPAEALFELLSDEMDHTLPEDVPAHVYVPSDYEEGQIPTVEKTLALWQDRERALAKLQVWDFSGSDLTPEEEENCDPYSNQGLSILVNLGLFFLLQSLMTSKKTATLVISSSPLSFFFTISSALSVSLKCTSAAALLSVLLFLAHCVRHIPSYSIEFPGEVRELSNPMDRAEEPCAYRTEQYRVFFEILKQLTSLSVLCPHPILRTLSRSITLELLKRLGEQTRIRTYMTLLVLSPFASVAAELLNHVMKQEWDFSRDQNLGEISSSLLGDLPHGLVQAMTSFLQHVERGASEFIDPLIVLLNFFRIFIIKDRSLHKSRLLIYDKADKLILTSDRVDAEERKGNNSWPWSIRHLSQNVLPRCRQFLALVRRSSSEGRSDSHSNRILFVTLSPLDEFALSSAVDGVSALLPVGEEAR